MNARTLRISLSLGFLAGALVPLFWGVLAFLTFDFPEGRLSTAFWKAVYITCPFWRIDGYKAYILMPLLSGCMYAVITVIVVGTCMCIRRSART